MEKEQTKEKIVRVLVICSQKENYFELFQQRADRARSSGLLLLVEQAPWCDVEIASHPRDCVVSLRPNRAPFPGTEQHKHRTFCPDFLLLRSYALGNHEHDWRLKLWAFHHHDVPALNSLDSFVWSVEKATHYTKLRRVQKSLPDFPLIPQVYYSHPSTGSFPPDFPCVLKVGSSSQGVGKSKINDIEQWKDMLSVLAMSKEYFVTEPYIPWKGDVRVQKIGNHYRAIERSRMSEQSSWKANDPVGIVEKDVECEKRWKQWIDAASVEMDMEICGMDVLIGEDGKEYILEVNSSSIGFPQRHATEDCGYIADLCVERMVQIFSEKVKSKKSADVKSEKSKKKEKSGKK